MKKRILDIKTSTYYNKDGAELKNIRLKYGVMNIDVTLNEKQTNDLLRAIIQEKSEYPLEVRNFEIPPLPIGKRKQYFDFNEDTLKPRIVDF